MFTSPDQIQNFFKSHWTVRKYKNFKIPQHHLDIILEAAQRAPTDATAQMYSIIRLTDLNLRKQIATLSANAHIETASEAFIICADIYRLQEILKVHNYEPADFPHIAIHFALGDAVLAGQNLLIASEMLGYKGCWIGGLISEPDEISKLIQLPKGTFPYAALTIGVPDEEPQSRPRLPREQIVHENTYRKPTPEELIAGAIKMAPISARGNWPQTLARYFAVGGSMETREIKMKNFLQKMIFSK